MLEALRHFSISISEKFSVQVVGEPEDQIRAPFEQFIRSASESIGFKNVVAIGETLLANSGGRPDYGIAIDKLLCGHVELKAPGKGAKTDSFVGHDKKQWDKFRNLPNILYSDGRDFALYRMGVLVREARLSGDPRMLGGAAIDVECAKKLEVLLRDFLSWEPIVPGSSKQLVEYLAPLCRSLRDDVLEALRNRVGAVEQTARDWRRFLFPGADDRRFADAYAQTVTFSLLLARSNGSDTLFIDEAVASLTHANSLLARALSVLTDPLVREHLGASLGMLQRVISRVPSGTMSGGRRDPWLHFYEEFLADYDPDLRRDAGAYYTPVEVVQAQVKIVDELLRNRLGKKFGFATGGVNVLDPAVGTGTYLLGVIEHALETVRETEGPGALPARADVLGSSLYGFEIMVGPYAVASLRLTRMLHQYGGHLPGDGPQVMLSNTLESPYEKIPELPLVYRAIGLEHRRAKRVKETVPVLVCIGNPPYDRHAAVTDENRATAGGWVRWGELGDGRDAILNDFIEPVRKAGKGGDLKNLYNLYVYFWRWALWKTFEQEVAGGPGVISFITASSFVDGDAFIGMRQHMRKVCDEIWVIDLGGEGRGTRRDDNVFAIQTPVAVTIAVRYGSPNPLQAAKVHYTRIEGARVEKLALLEGLESLSELIFQDCPDGLSAPFRPRGEGRYFGWPLLTDLMPWQHSGVQIKRTWPIAPEASVLASRWFSLMAAPAAERAVMFKETRDRTVIRSFSSLNGSSKLPAIVDLPADSAIGPVVRYGFRSFDRQYLIADNRVGDFMRPVLWQTSSDKQLFFASMFTQPLGAGAAISVSSDVPDMHYFSGRGAKDILPLYRDADCKLPNLHPKLLAVLGRNYGVEVSPDEFAAYLYGILSASAYTELFHEEMETRELRVPLTTNYSLFKSFVKMGKELIFLHTYGERFSKEMEWPVPIVKCLAAVPAGALPQKFEYDDAQCLLKVDSGCFGPVSRDVWEFEVSGLKVVQSWLGYRIRSRKGKKTSVLDEVVPSEWGSEYTSELLRLLNIIDRTISLKGSQAVLLQEILESGLIAADELEEVPSQWRKAPGQLGDQEGLEI